MANKRRGNKEGYFHQRKNGSWRVQLYHQGNRLSFSAKTKKECQEWLDETRNLIKSGVSVRGLSIKTSEFLNQWLNNKQSSVSDKVHNQYFQVARDYIIPNIGRLKLRDITPLHLIGLYKKKSEKQSKSACWLENKTSHPYYLTSSLQRCDYLGASH